MQLASIPKPVLAANQQVAGALATAHQLTAKVQADFESTGATGTAALTDLSSALEAAWQARDGVTALGKGNLLDGTFQRYAVHSVRHLADAVSMLERPGPLSKDSTGVFAKRLFDAEVSTRLGSAAAERSLAKPSPKAIERATSFTSSSSSGDTGPAWVDGQWLDSLGNPVRGSGDVWTGPDGQSFDSMGNAVDGGRGGDSFTGPDGETYSGI